MGEDEAGNGHLLEEDPAVKIEIGKGLAKGSPTLAKNRLARMGHPKASFGIKARPPAGVCDFEQKGALLVGLYVSAMSLPHS